jgi:hypothetical protein
MIHYFSSHVGGWAKFIAIEDVGEGVKKGARNDFGWLVVLRVKLNLSRARTPRILVGGSKKRLVPPKTRCAGDKDFFETHNLQRLAYTYITQITLKSCT